MEITTFNLGTSTVVTLPKRLGIPPGQKLKARKYGSSITLTPTRTKSFVQKQLKKDLDLIERLAGGMNYSSNLSPQDMNRIYDEEVYGN